MMAPMRQAWRGFSDLGQRPLPSPDCRSVCRAVIVFPDPAGWPDVLRPARSLGTGGA